MFAFRLQSTLFKNVRRMCAIKVRQKNTQISIVGATNDIGSNLALMLKQNSRVTTLNLYDDDEKIKGLAAELNHIPGGPAVFGFSGPNSLGDAIDSSHLIVMVSRAPRKLGVLKDHMLDANAPSIRRLCMAMTERNPDALLAISTNPINCIIPFVSAVFNKYHRYNPFKIFGITNIDTARSRSYAANLLNANPRHLNIPVIGGHSDETIVPLFSNLKPDFYSLDANQADMLTRLVKKAGLEVVNHKRGNGASSLAMAWAINEFVEGIVTALSGRTVELHCYTANPHFGTRFFAGPNVIGPYGIIRTCSTFEMSELECTLLSKALRAINKDITIGEDYAYVFG